MSLTIKTREIQFSVPHADTTQAYTAMMLLTDITGIVETRSLDKTRLLIRYDIIDITLEQIELALHSVGFHLNNSVFCKIKRALYYYTEEVERANMGLTKSTKDFNQVFVDQYQRRPHGCRDERPEHWREYR